MGTKTRLLASGKTEDNEFNISLLGFKMAVNEGLTVFNLVDGVVDEFHDESGTDEAEGSNDTYCATSDFYKNQTAPVSYSAGFSTTAVTEGDTSTAGTNPAVGSGTFGTFTVPSGLTSVSLKAWGAGGGAGVACSQNGGGGGFSSGTLAVTASQVLHVNAGEGGAVGQTSDPTASGGGYGIGGGGDTGEYPGGGNAHSGGGGGGAGIANANNISSAPQQPGIYLISGAGGGGAGGCGSSGAGGGLTGQAGTIPGEEGESGGATQVNYSNARANPGGSPGPYFSGAGGGDQESGGQGGAAGPGPQGAGPGQSGSFLQGGTGAADGYSPANSRAGGGGGGLYGGGGSGNANSGSAGGAGGGSSYYGHPQITSGATEAGEGPEGGGTADPLYVASTNEGAADDANAAGEDGYVFITGTACGSTTSTTIVSTAFSANSVPTSSRIVVFEENVDTPTLNTDIIASISRDGGSTFTTATLSDSGYVTGSSGQRILTGQATISGQPSGQSMRWKLALANNAVKIHGVSLQWS